jgi:NDP-sugar pyrophosphorylase family protein
MAGGEGRRLGQLTSVTPKPMLPVGGQPMLQHTLAQLRDQGVQHAYLSVRHLSHVICDYFGDGRWLGIDIDYVVDDQPLGTAGAIALIPRSARPVLVLNGDIMTPVPVASIVAHHERLGAAVTIGSVEEKVTIPYGVMECGESEVVRLQEKPALTFTIMAGVYLVAPEVAAGVSRDAPLSMPALVERALAGGRVVEFRLPGPWLDIGTPDQYARAEEMAARGAMRLVRPPTTARHGVGALALPEQVAVPALECWT